MKFRPFKRIAKLFRHRKPITIDCGRDCSTCSRIFNPSQLRNIVSQIGSFTGSESAGIRTDSNPGTRINESTEGSEVSPDSSPPSPLPSQPIPILALNERSHVEIGGHVFFPVGPVDYLLRIDAALSSRYTSFPDKAKSSIAKGEMRIVSPCINTVLIPGRKVVLVIGNGTANGTGYDEYNAKVELGYDANAAQERRNSFIGGLGPQTQTRATAPHVHVQMTPSGPRSGYVSRATSTHIGALPILHHPSQMQQLHAVLAQPLPIREALANATVNAARLNNEHFNRRVTRDRGVYVTGATAQAPRDTPANPNVLSPSLDVFYEARPNANVGRNQETNMNTSRYPPPPAGYPYEHSGEILARILLDCRSHIQERKIFLARPPKVF